MVLAEQKPGDFASFAKQTIGLRDIHKQTATRAAVSGSQVKTQIRHFRDIVGMRQRHRVAVKDATLPLRTFFLLEQRRGRARKGQRVDANDAPGPLGCLQTTFQHGADLPTHASQLHVVGNGDRRTVAAENTHDIRAADDIGRLRVAGACFCIDRLNA